MIREYWRFQSDCPTFRPVDPTGLRPSVRLSDCPIGIRPSDVPTVRSGSDRPTFRPSESTVIRPSDFPSVRSGSDRPSFRPSDPDPTVRSSDRPVRIRPPDLSTVRSDRHPAVRPSDRPTRIRLSDLPTVCGDSDRPPFRPVEPASIVRLSDRRREDAGTGCRDAAGAGCRGRGVGFMAAHPQVHSPTACLYFYSLRDIPPAHQKAACLDVAGADCREVAGQAAEK